MIRRIVVPLDGSAFGEHALPYALALAQRHGASLDLVHVHEVASLVYLEGVPQIDASVELDGIESDRSYLDRTLERVRAAGATAGATLLDGPTVSALESHIEASGTDLVVLTTHGRGPLSRAWLGSVADGLARHTTCPVLLIRPPEDADAEDAARPGLDAPAPRFRRVLVPLDGSDESESVVGSALALAAPDASMLLIHVVQPTLVVGGHVFKLKPDQQQRLMESAQEIVAGASLEAAGRRVEREIVVANDVASSILQMAEGRDADLIALTTHGRGGLSRLVFGSVTDKVIRGASGPVLIRRPG